MLIIDTILSLAELKHLAEAGFGNMVKAVVDVEREIMAVDGELHSDEEALLLEGGSRQEFLWGINIRPSRGNRSRGVDDPAVREKILQVVGKRVRS